MDDTPERTIGKYISTSALFIDILQVVERIYAIPSTATFNRIASRGILSQRVPPYQHAPANVRRSSYDLN
jgi:hypothetical protein